MKLANVIRHLEQQLKHAEKHAAALRGKLLRIAKLADAPPSALRQNASAGSRRRRSRRKLSAAGRANIVKALKARWDKYHREKRKS